MKFIIYYFNPTPLFSRSTHADTIYLIYYFEIRIDQFKIKQK